LGIFSEADHHPFHEGNGEIVVEDARGGMGAETWHDDSGVHEYVRPVDRTRGLYIQDKAA
jgi:hypothetical protein